MVQATLLAHDASRATGCESARLRTDSVPPPAQTARRAALRLNPWLRVPAAGTGCTWVSAPLGMAGRAMCRYGLFLIDKAAPLKRGPAPVFRQHRCALSSHVQHTCMHAHTAHPRCARYPTKQPSFGPAAERSSIDRHSDCWCAQRRAHVLPARRRGAPGDRARPRPGAAPAQPTVRPHRDERRRCPTLRRSPLC